MNEKSLVPEQKVVFTGRLGEVIDTYFPDGRTHERYRRPPGVRLIIVTPQGNFLMTKEYRHETGNTDLRLPGGKVCDSLEAYHALLESGRSLDDAALEAAIKEGREEVGISFTKAEHIATAKAGASVEWDLHYVVVTDYEVHPDGQDLELGETISTVEISPLELREAIAAGQMQEWRSVGVLLGRVLPHIELS